jgi:hypothetical protein
VGEIESKITERIEAYIERVASKIIAPRIKLVINANITFNLRR